MQANQLTRPTFERIENARNRVASMWQLPSALPPANDQLSARLLLVTHQVVDSTCPGEVVVASETEGLSRDNLTRCHVVNLVGQRQDEATDTIDPCNQYLIRFELPTDIEIAAVAIVEVSVL